MSELVSDDLVMSSGLCSWSPTFTLHDLSNSGVEAALMCLNLLRLPSCVRTPHIVSRGTLIPYSTAVNLVEGLESVTHGPGSTHNPYLATILLYQNGYPKMSIGVSHSTSLKALTSLLGSPDLAQDKTRGAGL
ncbi:hypothetical protein M9H77_07633 [Catharanthus roseus]|uniref:Uncharacterized protein n=1 Tax=Catharanthus roseus TaxID=4058 RepID=A0ACC0BVR8_CATRO|nr:hypothetical protein M9H77_07633 [Catharanthus roseus]